jgi:hypothetical protein
MLTLRLYLLALGPFFLAALFCTSAVAQSAIYNTPSTDVMPRGGIYLEGGVYAHPGSYENGGYQSYGARVVYGATNKLELGLNAYYTEVGEGSAPVEIQPNFKYRFFDDESKGVAAAVGGMLYAPATHVGDGDTVGMVYATVSKKVRKTYGPRVTGGVYGLVGAEPGSGTAGGAIVAYEQPVTGRVSLLADWYSGKNRVGSSAVSVGFTLTSKSYLYLGYSISNEHGSANYVGVSYGYTF